MRQNLSTKQDYSKTHIHYKIRPHCVYKDVYCLKGLNKCEFVKKKCISLLGRILTPGCKHFGMKPISSYIYKSIKACDIWYCILLVIVNLYGIIELVFILVGVVSLTCGN